MRPRDGSGLEKQDSGLVRKGRAQGQGQARGRRRGRPLSVEPLEGRTLPTSASLLLQLASTTVAESAGPAATTATVSRVGASTQSALNVAITSSNPAQVTVPATVTIPAGQTSATFNVGTIDDGIVNGNQAVTINTTAPLPGPLAPVPGFNSQGTVGGEPTALALQADGKVIEVSSTNTTTGPVVYSFGAQRYNTDGSLDTSFNHIGFVNTRATGQVNAVAVQPDGKIVLAGTVDTTGTGNYNFSVVRYNPDGSLDTSFGTGGIVTIVPTTWFYNEIWSVAIEADGKILLGGNVDHTNLGYMSFAVTRLNSNGSLDTSFGSGGYAETTPNVISGAGSRWRSRPTATSS